MYVVIRTLFEDYYASGAERDNLLKGAGIYLALASLGQLSQWESAIQSLETPYNKGQVTHFDFYCKFYAKEVLL